ncbi:MAG: DUF2442 domain-containing protein [Myxococcaceae bacterium]
MRQNSQISGINILRKAEVVNLSSFGFWLYDDGKEFFLSFSQFPWFKKATIEQIFHVVKENNNHFHWPELDIDLDLQRIQHPEQYPLRQSSV